MSSPGLRPIDKKSLAALGEAIFHDRRTLQARSHRVFVIFDYVYDRKLEERSHVQRLIEAALVHGAIAEEAKCGALETFVFDPVGEAEAERSLAADNAVAAPVILVRCEEMH